MSNSTRLDSRHMYSWWWDSHNTPKNSKWLQENLTDMDGKVKSMIKLIEEDADSFARRAEMYYKKRPELMKLVEEFYRAYRALAERYNHATGELRHAQQTIAKAFPDEVHFDSVDDELLSQAFPLFDGDGHFLSEGGLGKKGLKQLPEMFRSKKLEGRVRSHEENPKNAESEVECLKKELSNMKSEKENVLVKYQQCLDKLSEIETELNNAQKNSVDLGERAGLAEIEVQTLKEALIQFEVEKIANMIKQNCYLEKISCLEALASQFQDEMKGLDGRASEADSRACNLQGEISKLELEKETVVLQYMQSLGKISDLENIISSNEDETKFLKNQAEISESEVFELKQAFAVLNKEKEDTALEYKCCLEKISELEKELSTAKKEVGRLNNEVSTRDEKLKNALEKCTFMEESSRSLRDQVDNLAKKIETKDQELVLKQEELEKFQNCLLDESSRCERLEEALESLQNLQLRSSDDRRALELEMNNVVQMLKEMEISKNGLEVEIRCMRSENHTKEKMQSEILSMAKVELEGLREKSKGLEEICELLKSERSYLLTEKRDLVLKLEKVEKKLKSFERKYMGLEAKYADLEKEKEGMHSQVEKLKVSLCGEIQERVGSKLESETRLAGLEDQIHLLQEENKWKKKESEEELDKSLKAQFEISILHKFIKDMEEKNCSLIIECQKHVDASKLAEKVISELESKSIEQHVEAEHLLDEIERLRLGIYQIFRALECGSNFENEGNSLNCILGSIEDLRCNVFRNEDENLQLLVENSVLLAFVEEMESKGMDIESKKVDLERELRVMEEKLVFVEKEKCELLELNVKLKSDANKGRLEAKFLESELDSLCVKQGDLRKAYNALQDIYARVNEENTCLLKKFSELKEEKSKADQRNDVVLLELLATENQYVVLKSFGRDKVTELKLILENLSRQRDISSRLEKEMNALSEKLDLHKAENVVLKDAIFRLEKERHEAIECNVQLNKEVIDDKERLNILEAKLRAAERLNSDLHGTLSELKTESLKVRENLEKDVSMLSADNSAQKKEIECLSMVNKNLESELSVLRLEMEEKTTREHKLITELQEMNNEFELWEAEASSFCFDLQVCSVHEVLLKNKVEELCGVCKNLEINHEGKVLEIEEMKGKICLMENQIHGLKSQLHAYGPVIASFRDDIEILEGNALLHRKADETYGRGTELLEVPDHPTEEDTSRILPEDRSLLALQSLQMRVKVVGEMIQETNKPFSLRRSSSCKTQEVSMIEIDPLKPHHSFSRRRGNLKNELSGSPKLQRLKSKRTYIRDRTLTKDIPLDQVCNDSSRRKGKARLDDIMLELWETKEDENKIPELAVDKLELSARKTDAEILEKLASDAEKLELLQTSLQNLRRKSERKKKGRDENSNAVVEQLQEANDALVHLVDLNGQLAKNIIDCPKDEMEDTVRAWRVKVMEQAEKGSERIERLELELQKIQYSVLKMEDEKRSKAKNKSVILSELIDNGRKNSPRCACFRQLSSKRENVS